ncbi:MAG TPA: glycosyltransferase family 4 protein [Gemmatimonadaceae bacterium]
MKRILFIGTSRGPGGTESHLITLACAMADAGYQVSAVACEGDVIYEALADHGGITLRAACFEKTRDWRAIAAVYRACRELEPDEVVGSFRREFWPIAIVARCLGIPVTLFVHTRRMRRVTAWLLPALVRRLIFPSADLREWAVKRGVSRRRTALLYNPIDVKRLSAAREMRCHARETLGFQPRDVVIGFMGRFEDQKGIHPLAEILDRVMDSCPNARALWVGSGADGNVLRARLAASRHADRHLIRQWTASPETYYAAMDVLAFPSLRNETFGRVSAEAQACGVPVAASRVGGIPETLIDGETGVLLGAADVAAWIRALEQIVNDESLRARMGRLGSSFVSREFAAPHIAEQFAQLLALPARPATRRQRRSAVPDPRAASANV